MIATLVIDGGEDVRVQKSLVEKAEDDGQYWTIGTSGPQTFAPSNDTGQIPGFHLAACCSGRLGTAVRAA